MAYANLPIRGPADLNRANVAAFDALLRDIDAPYWCTAPAATASAPWLRCGQPGLRGTQWRRPSKSAVRGA
jgi:hypothetical protein